MTSISTSENNNQSADIFVTNFHQAAPYIHYLRNKTLIIAINSDVLHANQLANLSRDIQLLHSLGLRLVLIYDNELQVAQLARHCNYTLQYYQQQRITDKITLQLVKQANGLISCDLQAALSAIPVQTPDHHAQTLTVTSGNVLLARPLGVIDGVDMCYSGVIRKIDTEAIKQRLEQNQIVLVNPIGYSLSGQAYSINSDALAAKLAISLQAEKILFLNSDQGLVDEQQQLISQLTSAEIEPLLQHPHISTHVRSMLRMTREALENGVQRVHFISGLMAGSLIRELFTHEGCGTAVAQNSFVCIRAADHNDIGDILQLIAPLEAAGILLPRDHEYLENHIHEFLVLEHDCHVYGCVALHLYPEDSAAELGCLVVSPEARSKGFGELLLQHVIRLSEQQQVHNLFALSTQTGDWFLERGFMSATLQDLPVQRQQQYQQNQRYSKIYCRQLSSNN